VSDVLELSAARAAELVRAGELSSRELFTAYRERAAGDELGAFLWLPEEGARPLAGAAAGDRRGDPAAGDGAGVDPADSPLGGVPLAVKDIFCVEDTPTTAASRILEGYVPPYTATAVARLAAAGAPMLGKTNMDEFAMGSSNENSAYGPVRNPWDRERVPGGSSGGSAAAVAAGIAPWSIGTDTGGSIRQPAALCGLVGLKPTYGAVPRYGMIAFASSFDQCGPITRDVTDAALLYRALTAGGRDPCDATSVDLPEPVALPTAERLDGLRVGVVRELSEAAAIEPGVKEVFGATLARVEELGGSVEEVSLPHSEHGLSAYYVLAPAEASSNLARYDGARFGLRAEAGDLLSLFERTRAEGFGPEVKRRIMLGTYALSSGYYEAYYGRAQRVRTKIAEDFASAFERVDLVVTPTSPSAAFRLGERTDDPLAMYMADYCTVPMSLAGLPAISIPAGLSDGLPIGFQVTGPAFSENRLLAAAHALERAIGFDISPARRSPGAAQAEVGAR
jgi:aspartyl-tRNA(Asn)/glutamyl-tRNA(Gln) amidotransferase subunit A